MLLDWTQVPMYCFLMEPKRITLNGVDYEPVAQRSGSRHVVVIDRGWIFAGDLTQENGRIHLDRAILVVRWSGIGFDGMIRDPLSDNVQLRDIPDRVDIPIEAELFRIPVTDDWGISQ
ncbi:MAG: hypothetical protein F6J89_17860 [Symploca sp. SIO1C4]|uniref:Uncharacterized protein n=1 Tax=Symploca sp. SIO1C4 TaxID=2607765 RepID=A0A6B3N719_9CYAN|nr:hypothetical protein [Symploca sp. SIO1C4]